MNQIISTFMLLATNTQPVLCQSSVPPEHRQPYGIPDKEHKYNSYVVSLLGNEMKRQCTGTLLSVQWVLTTVTCLLASEITHVQYGEALAHSDTQSKAKVIEERRYPHFATDDIDIALIRVTPIFLSKYAKLSYVDVSTIIGHPVEYAGYKVPDDEDCHQPLMIGEGLVRPCVDEKYLYDTKVLICVIPKLWANESMDSAGGDTGGPLFFDGEVIGVIASVYVDVAIYTAIGPYITWIRRVIKK